MERLFSAFGKVQSEHWAGWASLAAREFYEVEVEVEDSPDTHFIFEKGLAFPASLTHLSTNCNLSFHRGWQNIRQNKVGLRTLCFVSHGSLTISRSQGATVLGRGELAILNSNLPFHCRAERDEAGSFEMYQLTVPADLFLAHLQGADQILTAINLETPEGKVVQRMLNLIVREGGQISRRTAKPIMEGLLEAIADCIGLSELDVPRRQTLVDKRLSDIENYILMNLSDPDLCYDRVAANCGISPRYLCYVLKANNTSFSELLWKNRLPRARDLLGSPATRNYPIHEIAYMSGFKSAAHFSRMFKATYGCPPREFRASLGSGVVSDISSVHEVEEELLLAAA